jgi:hypothetical protein
MFNVNVMIRDEMWPDCLESAVLHILRPSILFRVSAGVIPTYTVLLTEFKIRIYSDWISLSVSRRVLPWCQVAREVTRVDPEVTAQVKSQPGCSVSLQVLENV